MPTGDRIWRTTWMRDIAGQRLGVEPRQSLGGHDFHAASPENTAPLIVSPG